MHHAHDRRDDAERGHAVAELVDAVDRDFAFVMVGLDLVVHQVFDLERVQVAAHHEPQVVGDELDHVMVGEDPGIFGEERAFLGLLDVALDRHQAFLADLREDVVEERHQLHVHVFRVDRAFEHRRQRLEGRLDRLGAVADEESAGRGAADHQQLDRLEQRAQMAAGQGEAAEDRTQTMI